MRDILNYIEEHLEEPLDIKKLSLVAGYSEYHFCRLFKKYTNETVMEYVCRRRLIRAAEEIATGMRILDVALKYGFQSHSAFSKAFNREFGFSPSLLRTLRLELDILGGNYMNQIFIQNVKVGTSKEELFRILKNSISKNNIHMGEAVLEEYYNKACKVYEGKKRYSGEDYVTHPLNVAIILTELTVNADTIVAGLFYDATFEGEEYNSYLELPEDELTLVKLADRLHNMRTIDFIDEKKKSVKAKETLEMYMPLAIKTGNKKLTEELNNLIIKYQGM